MKKELILLIGFFCLIIGSVRPALGQLEMISEYQHMLSMSKMCSAGADDMPRKACDYLTEQLSLTVSLLLGNFDQANLLAHQIDLENPSNIDSFLTWTVIDIINGNASALIARTNTEQQALSGATERHKFNKDLAYFLVISYIKNTKYKEKLRKIAGLSIEDANNSPLIPLMRRINVVANGGRDEGVFPLICGYEKRLKFIYMQYGLRYADVECGRDEDIYGTVLMNHFNFSKVGGQDK